MEKNKKYWLQGNVHYTYFGDDSQGGCCDNWHFRQKITATDDNDAIKKTKKFIRDFKKKNKESSNVSLNIDLVTSLIRVRYHQENPKSGTFDDLDLPEKIKEELSNHLGTRGVAELQNADPYYLLRFKRFGPMTLAKCVIALEKFGMPFKKIDSLPAKTKEILSRCNSNPA